MIMKHNYRILTIGLLSLLSTSSFSQGQFWRINGNNNTNAAFNFLGTTTNDGLTIRTNSIPRAQFTTGAPLNSWNGNFGDGLRIIAADGTNAHLDLFTSNNVGGQETHARFGFSGQVSGQNNRFEFISTGAALGNYYSTFAADGIHLMISI